MMCSPQSLIIMNIIIITLTCLVFFFNDVLCCEHEKTLNEKSLRETVSTSLLVIIPDKVVAVILFKHNHDVKDPNVLSLFYPEWVS